MNEPNLEDITSLANDFRAAREYIDACLNPYAAPPSLKPSITGDARTLSRLLSELEQKAVEVPVPSFSESPPPSLSGEPDFTGVKLKKRGAFRRAWKKQHEDLRIQYEHNKSEASRRRVEALARNDQVAFQRHVIVRLRRDVAAQTFNGRILITEKLNWVLLEPGSDSLMRIRKYYDEVVRRHPDLQIDHSRVESVHGLSPQAVYTGRDEFDGYLVFLFRDSRLAVLECPIVGNALYLISEDWVRLSRLSKTELLRKHSEHVERIIHGATWLQQLKQRLRGR